MRGHRVAVPVVAGLLGLLALSPSASAGESISNGYWSGSALDAGPSRTEVGWYQLSGTFKHFRDVSVTVFAVPGGEGPCAVAPVAVPSGQPPLKFAAYLTIPCNGTYTVAATAVTTDNRVFPQDSATLDRTVEISAPAPAVTGLTVEPADDDRSLDLAWDDMRPAAADLSGYVVDRQVGDEPFERIGTLGPDQNGYTDDELPADAGEARYRVSSTRPTPDGEVTSQSTDAAPTSFAAAPATGAGSADGPGSPAGPADGGSGAGGGGGTTSGGPSSASISHRAGFSSSFPSSLLRPFPQPGRGAGGPTTTVDGGFDEELNYAAEPGGSEPVLPDDAMASIFSKPEAGRGLAIPLATGLVLAMWAFHLRRLAAAAARPMA